MPGTKTTLSAPLVTALACVPLLVGCEGSSIPNDFWGDFANYRTKPHYRAFAMTKGGQLAERAAGYSWSGGSVDAAIEKALELCQEFRELHRCRVFYIGDIKVEGMSDEELKHAKEVYRGNRSATNDDL